jgi:hypothetical protein
MKPIRWTILRAANEFGVDRSTLTRALIREGHEIRPSARGQTPQDFRTRDIVAALFGDEDRARARDLEASAKLKEQKHARLAGELVDWSEVESRVGRFLAPLRTAIVTAKAVLPSKVNPTDPHLARAAIETWESQTLALLSDEARAAAMTDSTPEAEDDEEAP